MPFQGADTIPSHRNYKNSLKLHEWTLEQKRRARSEGKEAPEGEFVNFQTPELSSLAKLVSSNYALR